MLDVAAKTWTPEGVKKALSEAYRVLSASEGRVGHKRLKAAWPEHAVEWEDLLAQQQHKTTRKTMIPRLRPTSVQIARMEMILLGYRSTPAWLNGKVMGFPTGRKMLIAAAMAAAHRYSGRQVCEAFGWAESTYRWRVERAAAIVAEELNRNGVEAW